MESISMNYNNNFGIKAAEKKTYIPVEHWERI